MTDTVDDVGYMCLTDFENELYNANSGTTIYATEEEIRERRPCVDGCGIVKVQVQLIEIIQYPKD